MPAPKPNRWLRLRHPDGFPPERFFEFGARCRIFRAYVEASIAEAQILGVGKPTYLFFAPELSSDRTMASLPIGGAPTVASRHRFEDLASWMLWCDFPLAFREALSEGLTEGEGDERRTTWRKLAVAIAFGEPG